MPPKKAASQSPEAPTEQQVLMKDLLLLPEMQGRTKVDTSTVARYATALRSGVEFPSIAVAEVGGALLVTDGWHRYLAHQAEGRLSILAKITSTDRRGARRMAALANTNHGLRLKKGERLRNFLRWHDARGNVLPNGDLMSYRDIAREMGGLGHTTIARWMRDHRPATAAKMGKDPVPDRDEEKAPDPAHDAEFITLAGEALVTALAAARGIRDPGERGQFIRNLEVGLKQAKADAPWEPPMF